MIHVATFVLPDCRYTYWRYGMHSLLFVRADGYWTVSADGGPEVQSPSPYVLAAWLEKEQE